jgi:NTP pyrophosphatase (non-canonical NTP hydrolase)
MNDDTLTFSKAKKVVEQFVAERDWQQFHSPKNLSMDIAAEAAELMEFFLWVESSKSLEKFNQKQKDIEDEVADVLMGLLSFCNTCNIDLGAAFFAKLESTKKKYPVDKVKGRAVKYTDI